MLDTCFQVEQELEKLEEQCSTRASIIPLEFVHSVQTIFRELKAQLHSPVHAAGYALDPEFLECQGLDKNTEFV